MTNKLQKMCLPCRIKTGIQLSKPSYQNDKRASQNERLFLYPKTNKKIQSSFYQQVKPQNDLMA
jgi:hypothetical protein